MKIYVISLKRSPERRQRAIEQMASHDIDFEFFDAVDGQLEHPLFADYDYKKCLWLTSGKMPTRGELGCYASHYLLWMHSIAINQPIVVLEDDVVLHPSFKNTIDMIGEDIEKYGFIRLEPVRRGKKKQVLTHGNYTISMMEDNFGGAGGYAISPISAAKLIKHRWSLPVDCFIGLAYLHNMTSYVIEPCIVDHDEVMPTTVQSGFSKAAWYRKPSRELYTFYKKIMIKFAYLKNSN
ncbi:glycosyltransferase family 25 protein [Aeromonas salmonicida]|uniref:glycosyltransferase family 25 protein n=1 Tax=Aeromonas salmonicida TaxID=645 RepID=UPI0029B7D6D8|nr:glycosyltransferase family 25 protein [Aeromonas salmonicida]HEH9422614.1 glycosyltransferase family 25 protein [Aeromonas salmonicida]HEH9435673.1 glycosyltransferase family 25 protein [Aeromonas salmonicida]